MRNQRQLCFIPSGGLGNRMRAVASAYLLHSQTGVEVRVKWFRDWALDAPFASLFLPFGEAGFSITDARRWEYAVFDRPRRKNLFVPRLFQSLMFGDRIDEQRVTPLKHLDFDFEQWARTGSSHKYMSCYQEFGNPQNRLYPLLFRPTPKVDDLIGHYCRHFAPRTIGLHIRRTDNQESIDKSPLRLFFDAVDREVALDNQVKVFVATDDEPTKCSLVERYGSRAITSEQQAERGSVAGIQGAVAEMYTLARCAKIYGSAGSSFSVMAARVGNTALEILETDSKKNEKTGQQACL